MRAKICLEIWQNYYGANDFAKIDFKVLPLEQPFLASVSQSKITAKTIISIADKHIPCSVFLSYKKGV